MKETLQYLEENFATTNEALKYLTNSIERCKNFIYNREFTEDQLIELEALTSRFSRVSDLLIQKVFKTIDVLDGTTPGTVRDRLLEAEKKGLITSADEFMQIRLVRNRIAHEYEIDDLKDIFVFAFKNSNLLVYAVKKAEQYSKKFN